MSPWFSYFFLFVFCWLVGCFGGGRLQILKYIYASLFWFRLLLATKAPSGRPSPRRGTEENEKKEAETGGSG